MGLMSVMSEWVQENTSILSRKTFRNYSFSSSDKREMTYEGFRGMQHLQVAAEIQKKKSQ